MNLRTLLLGAATAGAALALASTALADTPASASVSTNGTVKIIRPITIAKSADLVFGTIVKPSAGNGSVALTNTGGWTVTGAVALSTHNVAAYTISGEGQQAYSISVPASFDMTGPGTITVTLDPSLNGAQNFGGSLGGAATQALNIGGSFTVSDTMATGNYQGSYLVTVNYQ